jgi:hypothetical protein
LLNAVANTLEYIGGLKLVIEHLHKCSASYLTTQYIEENFNCETLWNGPVEVFDVTGHPKANRCYGWSCGEPEEFIILELPPVTDAQSAVKVGVAFPIKKARNQK